MAEHKFSTGDVLNPSGARLLGVGADGGVGVVRTVDMQHGYVQNPSGAAGVVGRIAQAAVVAGTQIVSFTYGDSVGDFLSSRFVDDVANMLVQTGWGGTALGTSFSGGAAATEAGSRYDVSMTGTVVAIPESGTVVYSVGGGGRSVTKAAVWLETGVGLGTAKVELIDASNNVTATISAATDCTAAESGFVRVAWTGSVSFSRIKVTATSGAVNCIFAYFGGSSTVSGIQNVLMTNGGITASLAGDVAFDVLYDVVTYLQPDACWYTNRETEENVNLYNGPLVIEKYREIAPYTSIVVCGKWATSGETTAYAEDAASMLENAALQQSAYNIGGVFIDAYALFPTYDSIIRVDPEFDGVHLGNIGRNILYSHFAHACLVFDVYGAASPRNTKNTSSASELFSVIRSDEADPVCTIRAPNAYDTYVDVKRWLYFKDKAGVLPAVVKLVATSGNGQCILFNNASAFASRIQEYTDNGQWSLVVNGSTGAATLYARVGGVLKSLTLGTLA